VAQNVASGEIRHAGEKSLYGQDFRKKCAAIAGAKVHFTRGSSISVCATNREYWILPDAFDFEIACAADCSRFDRFRRWPLNRPVLPGVRFRGKVPNRHHRYDGDKNREDAYRSSLIRRIAHVHAALAASFARISDATTLSRSSRDLCNVEITSSRVAPLRCFAIRSIQRAASTFTRKSLTRPEAWPVFSSQT
jgi:hypothetical protein